MRFLHLSDLHYHRAIEDDTKRDEFTCRWEVPFFLASNNSPVKDWARELTVDASGIAVKGVPISREVLGSPARPTDRLRRCTRNTFPEGFARPRCSLPSQRDALPAPIGATDGVHGLAAVAAGGGWGAQAPGGVGWIGEAGDSCLDRAGDGNERY